MIRHQLPGYSPLTLGGIMVAAARGVAAGRAVGFELEAYLSERFRGEEVVLTGSGTQALQLALGYGFMEGPGAGRPVALPAYACFDLVTAAVGAGVPVVFYDVDPAHLGPDADSFRRVIADGAGTVVVGNLYGFPLDWDWIRGECGREGVLVVEDAAQGVGSEWKGRAGGTF
ncbi:MAG: DegT/DnrJ/EryC1/StrS family aminotransferase, partial [Gemmatimonadota bacterium]|nr:DegT/DnrJ/EryC1/StrS family aminotransferase [Gemmatimonadota bacterium]